MQPDDLNRNFFCPLCRSNHFLLVTVRSSKTGTLTVVDGLYQRAGCTVIFANAEAFTQLMRDSIVDRANYRERQPMREYPPDAETIRTTTWNPKGKDSEG